LARGEESFLGYHSLVFIQSSYIVLTVSCIFDSILAVNL
jgi:hypothetical protein